MLKILIFTCLIIYTNILFSFPKPNVHYLKNGATAVIVVDPNSKISSSYVFVRSGSINEGEFLGSGVSHYLEHLLAGGTTAFKSEKEYQNIIDNLGGAYNAYTSYDHTAYYIHTSSININKALQTLYEWTVFGDWTSDEFFRENGVIKKEMERAENNIDRKIYQNTQQLFYRKSPYQYPILGYTDIFDTLTDQDLRKYHKQNYIPKNFVIVVGGDVSKNAVIELIENTFGQQLNKAPKNTYSGTSQQILSESMSSIVIPELKSKRLVLRYPTVSFYDSDVYSLDLLAYIFGNGQQSLMYQEFVVKKKIATNVRVKSITPTNEYGYFEIYLETDIDSEMATKEVQDFINKIKVLGISKNQIEAAINQKKNEYILSNTSLEYYLRDIGQSMMMGNNPLFFSVYSKSFKNITNRDLIGAVNKYLVESKCQKYEFKNKTDELTSKSETSANQIIYDEYLPGISLVFMPESNSEIVKMSIRLNGGLGLETKDINGIGFLSSKLIGKSTKYIPRNKYQKIFENKGAVLNSSINHNYLTYSLTTTQYDAPELIPYYLKGLTKFDIEPRVFDEVKSQVIKSIERKDEDWFESSFDKFKVAIFKNSSIFSSPLKGSVQSITDLDKDEVEDYVNNRLTNSEIQIVIHGKNPEQYGDLIRNEIRRLSRRDKIEKEAFVFNETLESNVNISANVGVVMTATPIYGLNTLKSFISFELIDAILSGMRYPSGLLHKRLRGEKLVYVVHALPIQFSSQDFLFIYALTSKDKVLETRRIIEKSINDMNNEITEEQFELAKSQVLFNFQNKMQNINTASKEVKNQLNRYGRFVSADDYAQILNEITIDELSNKIKEVFSNETYFVLVNSKDSKSDNLTKND